MGLTKQYLRYRHDAKCNVVASSSGTVAAVSDNICAVPACESVHFYNMKTIEKVSLLLCSTAVKADLMISSKCFFHTFRWYIFCHACPEQLQSVP